METHVYHADRKEAILAQHVNPDLRRWGIWPLAEAASQEARTHRCDAWECRTADETLLGSGVAADDLVG